MYVPPVATEGQGRGAGGSASISYEGDMQEGMQVEYTETGFSVVTTDWKQRLVDEVMRTGYWPSSGYNAPEYGPVFGLTAEKRGELARRIAPGECEQGIEIGWSTQIMNNGNKPK